ncbi:MAG: hypothetical protein Q9192_007426 [Flavoplaca navasiana]
MRQERELAVSSGEASNASSDNDTDQIADSEGGHWAGRAEFSDRIRDQVNQRSPIKMVLPAFPWKSINNVDKVVGNLRDLGEVLALARLDQLCRDIETVYPRGGEVTIASDGLVFDGEYTTMRLYIRSLIQCIPEEHTWEYSEALAKIIEEKGFDRLNLRRVMDVPGFTDREPIIKQNYLSLTHRSREALMQKYGKMEDDIKALINTDHDTLMTYRGFIRFLETDLRPQYYRQKSSLWDWEDSRTGNTVFEPQYPNGLLIHPAKDAKLSPSLASDHVRKLKSLIKVFKGPIQVLGFANSTEVNEEMEKSKYQQSGELGRPGRLEVELLILASMLRLTFLLARQISNRLSSVQQRRLNLPTWP